MASPILVFHVGAGTLALVSGTAAMSVRKGSRLHRQTGNVFVVSMLCLGASGAFIGLSKHQTLNAMMGLLTFYLVATAWFTARRRDGHTHLFDYAALPLPLTVAGVLATYGVAAANSGTGSLEGYPAAAYFVFGSVALLFAAGDVRMLARGGVSGTPRIARHLARMCFGLFIATGSFFLGRQQIFPAVFRTTYLLVLLACLPLLLMIFWLVRVRRHWWSFRESYRSAAPSMSLPSR